MPGAGALSIVPAQLSFLAIYNPLLGLTDETLIDQIVFYYKAGRLRQAESSLSEPTTKEDKNDQNEQLRRVGLAQGIVNFAKFVLLGTPELLEIRPLIDDSGTSREGDP
jgi:First Longin domain of INTU, CCZ1 and HPS4